MPFVYGGEAGSGSELARDITSKAYPSTISVYQPKRAISPCTQVRRLAKQDAFALHYRPGCFNRSHKRTATSLPALMAKLPAPPPQKAPAVSPLADASCSAAASLSAQLSLIYGTATKAPHIRRFTSHPRYSVAALLTTPRTSTTQPQGIISNTPQKSVGCLRMRLRLCLRVAKIRTFAPLLVPLRCAGTIALLSDFSDFCSAGWRLPPPFACLGFRSRTPSTLPHPRT